jgi:hypothetical protein
MTRPWCAISSAVENWSVSVDLAAKIQLGLEEFETVRKQMAPLIAKPLDSTVGDIETAAACAMLHSFYTEIEKILKLIAREWDARIPSSDAWHKDLPNQMAVPTNTRPTVITSGLVEILSEFLAFRHLFRGASIALMRWDKLAPLVAKVDQTYIRTRQELETFQTFLRSQSEPS